MPIFYYFLPNGETVSLVLKLYVYVILDEKLLASVIPLQLSGSTSSNGFTQSTQSIDIGVNFTSNVGCPPEVISKTE